ncbi:MAG: SHOCT domain-containing protein [Phycisphaeraceae bacterium]|nr:SHOCT domain-containing protein [Phycisphaeraceae bacterium]
MLHLAKKGDLGEYLFWVGAAIGCIVLATLVILWYRRKVLGPQGLDENVSLLDELRAMKARGEISEEEYDATRHAMASRAAGKPRTPAGPRGVGADRVAPPGFDLTGAPLPEPEKPDSGDQRV